MAELILSTVNPDQEDLRIQLEQYLSTIDSWKGVVHSQTGQGILNMVAAIGAFAQASIRRKYQDSFPETVLSDRASYALASLQGIRLTRKLPASVTASITSAAVGLTVPAYTVFQGSGAFFFNREALFLTADTPQTVTLYEGKVVSIFAPGINTEYAMFVSEENGFQVSDVDVVVNNGIVPLERTTGGLWTLPNIKGFSDQTLPDGKMFLQFGTETYGGVALTNETLNILYVVTTGEDGNSLDTIGKVLTAPIYPSISGTFTTSPTGGANERSALSYKNIAAPAFGVFSSAITRQQYISMALQYPGVVDVITFAQREINPTSNEWMNLIRITLLTVSNWSTATKTAFLEYMNKNSAYSPKFTLKEPVAIVQNVEVEIYCYNWANSTQCRLKAIAAITTLLSPRVGILNWDLQLTDLTDAILEADPGIEYVIPIQPTATVTASSNPVERPTLTALSGGGGTLIAGTYFYAISAVTPYGTITTRNYADITTSSTGRIKIDWKPLSNVTNYYVYRKGPNDTRPGVIAMVSGSTLTYTDTGAAVTGSPPPPQNTVPVRYVKLGTLTVRDFYSTRNVRL